ncbi:MAG TPA: tryptophanase [Kofleriaceae bacterium]
MATLPEPWRVRVVEPIRLVSPERRKEVLARAGYNVFRIPANDVFVDLLTDSGTGAMSASQWAGMQLGDESYAGAQSWFHLESTVKEITGHPHVFPVHQGRGAEAIYCRAFVEPGDAVLGNLHFDTTRAHIQNRGGRPIDCVTDAGLTPEDRSPFKGDVDLEKAERAVRDNPGKVRLFILTVTANTNGGQPVSLANARAVRAFCTKHGIKLVMDAARFPENAYFIQQREPGQNRSVREIASELLGLADLVAMSAKKAALVNIGGFLSMRDEADYQRCLPWTILHEGYLTYGGMAGRDLEALARGLVEGLDEQFLAARIGQVARLHAKLAAHGIPLLHPSGGHSVVIDAGRFLDHLSREEFAAEALTTALYLRGGVRAVGHGALAFGELDEATGKLRPPSYENVRMAIPRRVYSDNHLDYVAEIVAEVFDDRHRVRGLRAVHLPAQLAIFTATLAPL